MPDEGWRGGRDGVPAPVAVAALAATLEAVDTPSFLLRPDGAVLEANAAGRALLRADPDVVGDRLRATLREGCDPAYAVTRLRAAGAPDHFLVLARAPPASPAARAATAAARWRLTPRQREVLTLLAGGESNKSIAAALGCAERTVELHVTALLEKAGCGHRAELVARFWTEP